MGRCRYKGVLVIIIPLLMAPYACLLDACRSKHTYIFLVMVLCTCNHCLGQTHVSRATLFRHLKSNGAASESAIQQAMAAAFILMNNDEE
jgi:hypothetical protein